MIIFRVYCFEVLGTFFPLIEMMHQTPYRQNEPSLSVTGRGMGYGGGLIKEFTKHLLEQFFFYLLKYVVYEFILIDMREFAELAEDGMSLDPV